MTPQPLASLFSIHHLACLPINQLRAPSASDLSGGWNLHDLAELKDPECETILKGAGGVIGDKGFIGTDYITTPVRKPQDRELYLREHEFNNQISSLHAPVERAVANLKTCRILFADYRRHGGFRQPET
jgi:hypothetical protein